MGHKLSPKDNELYKRVDEVLHYMWDPIGISDSPYARDEYYSYSLRVFSLLKSTTDNEVIADFLIDIAREQMGLGQTKNETKKIADILLAYKKKIFEE